MFGGQSDTSDLSNAAGNAGSGPGIAIREIGARLRTRQTGQKRQKSGDFGGAVMGGRLSTIAYFACANFGRWIAV